MNTNIPDLPVAVSVPSATPPHDLAALAEIAGRIFREVPGGGASPFSASSLPPAGTGMPPGGVALGGFGAPLTAVPSGLTSPAAAHSSLPEAVPVTAQFPTSPAFSPEPAVPSGLPGGLDAAPRGEAGLRPIPPLSASLPGEAELLALLSGNGRAPGPKFGDQVIPATAGQPSFYFLDTAAALPPGPSATNPVAAGVSQHPAFDVASVRADFPILQERVNGVPLIWLDNAATTQKPQAVIDRLDYFYRHENSNIHRAAHELAARATDAYESAREKVRRFLGAASSEEIIFVRGATEGINLIAQSWGRQNIRAGDEIVITWLEHHANIVPWQQLVRETGARLRVVPVDDRGQVLLNEYQRLLNDRTKLVAITQVSNALGTVTPAREMTALARRVGAHVLVDGAQAVSHMAVDVQALDCDWYVFSGHKVFAPTGIGVVYGKAAVLEAMPPWQGGGNMIRDVTFEKTEYQDAPSRFEAGTGNIADAVGLGAAIDYLDRIGMANIARHEHDLLEYGTRLLSEIPTLRIIGTAAEKAGVLSFVLDGIPPETVGKALNREGIAVRSGHHCAQPILRRFGLEATVRPSFALYNTFADIDALAAAVKRVRAGTLPQT